MLQWLSADGTSWGHRAFWGSDSILSSGWWGNRAYMGPLPPSGGWMRLEAPASAVDLDGRTFNGMAFTLYGGRASWDYAGFIRPTGIQQPNDYDTDGIPDCLEDRNGNGVTDTGETNWQDQNDLGLKVWITEPTDWQVHALCLMPNHFHLVAETPKANLVAGMKWLLKRCRFLVLTSFSARGVVFCGLWRKPRGQEQNMKVRVARPRTSPTKKSMALPARLRSGQRQ